MIELSKAPESKQVFSMKEPRKKDQEDCSLGSNTISAPIPRPNCETCAEVINGLGAKGVFTCKHWTICLECLNMYAKNCLESEREPGCYVADCHGRLNYGNIVAMNLLSIDIRTALRQLKKKR